MKIYIIWNEYAGTYYAFSTRENAENFCARYLKEVLEVETITKDLLEEMPIEEIEVDPKFDRRLL